MLLIQAKQRQDHLRGRGYLSHSEQGWGLTMDTMLLALVHRWKIARLAFSQGYDLLPDGIHQGEMDRLGMNLARAEAALLAAAPDKEPDAEVLAADD